MGVKVMRVIRMTRIATAKRMKSRRYRPGQPFLLVRSSRRVRRGRMRVAIAGIGLVLWWWLSSTSKA